MRGRVWNRTDSLLPANGQPVEVPNNGGTLLVYESGLWWFPDFSMYVYYTPEYWSAVS